jgi:TorA maturation chaperone TorD
MTANSEGASSSSLARAQVYEFLAAAFHGGISKEFLARIASPEFIGEIRENLGECDALKQLTEFSKKYEGDLEPHRLEYNSLFIVPGGKYLSPYESVYRDGRQKEDGVAADGILMGPSTLSVLNFYEKSGAKLPPDYTEMPDHIAAELEFMRYLCETEARALDEGKEDVAADYAEVQRRFLEEHLTRWMPDLFERLRKHTKSGLWLGLAGICQQFCESDLEELG